MRMGVRLAHRIVGRVRMLVVLVMDMAMSMFERFMGMLMLVPLC